MSKKLVKHIIGIFFTFILVFSTNIQSIAGYVDQQTKLEHKEFSKIQKNDNKLFSQSSAEEDNNVLLKDMTKKFQYFHEINLFLFASIITTKNYNYYHSDNYYFINDGVTTPPPEFI